MGNYDHEDIEKKWGKKWLEERVYEVDIEGVEKPHSAKASRGKPFYNLMMFPYPSAEGLHVGNMYAFTGADVYGRFQRMQGHDVFEPIGLDGFGIHSENYAIKVGRHPAEQAKVSEERFYEQLSKIGNGFAWEHRLETYDPDYYQWTQWLFIQMFKRGLAYRETARVNWCPSCKTVLADEQVENGECERCKSETTFKELEQWFFRITEYAEELLSDIEKLDWPEKIKIAQRNWIGKSEGVEVEWELEIPDRLASNPSASSGQDIRQAVPAKGRAGEDDTGGMESLPPESIEEKGLAITTFTTRLDTIYGATFLVVAPEHEVVEEILNPTSPAGRLVQDDSKKEEIQDYVGQASEKTEMMRKQEEKEKTGVDTGVFVKHPFTGERVPVWIADFVLMDYGTGAVMGVPAHDERDYDFATQYGLEKTFVIHPDSFEVGEDLEKSKHIFYRQSENGVSIVAGEKSALQHVQNDLSDTEWGAIEEGAIVEYGTLVNSGEYDGMRSEEAVEKMVEDLGEKAKKTKNYHLRDWLISRQRYWGPPIPMIYCEACAEENKSWVNSKSQISNNKQIPNSKSQVQNSMQNMVGWWPVPESELPVELPELEEFKPQGDGSAPLDNASEEWLYTECPECGGRAKRETDVSDTFLDSSWYFLAYPNLKTEEWGEIGQDPSTAKRRTGALRAQDDRVDLDSLSTLSNGSVPWDVEVTKRWLPVTQYIGGAEHAVLHLLYSRFVWKFLCDAGLLPFSARQGMDEIPDRLASSPSASSGQVGRQSVPAKGRAGEDDTSGAETSPSEESSRVAGDASEEKFPDRPYEPEPFPRLFGHGLIIKDGKKMSKSRGNVVNPDEYIEKYGADALRMYLMFLGPYDQGGDFRDSGMAGMRRFLDRVYATFTDEDMIGEKTDEALVSVLEATKKKMGEDMAEFKYNTAIAAFMEFMNEWRGKGKGEDPKQLSVEAAMEAVRLIAPLAPYLSEELWIMLREGSNEEIATSQAPGNDGFESVHLQEWPGYDEELISQEAVTVVVQVNGRVRATLTINKKPETINKEEVVELAKGDESVAKWLPSTGSGQVSEKEVKRVIWVGPEGKNQGLVNFVV